MTRPDRWTRRRLIGGSIAIAGTAALSPARAAALVATPRQTRGPFYPAEIPLDADSDLVQVQGRSDRADGQVVHLFGQVLDVTGRPLGGAVRRASAPRSASNTPRRRAASLLFPAAACRVFNMVAFSTSSRGLLPLISINVVSAARPSSFAAVPANMGKSFSDR